MNIIISPIHETFFSGRIWMGLDIEAIKQNFEKLNSDYEVQIIDFSLIANDYKLLPNNCMLFYSVSYNEVYQQYIKDIILDVSKSRPDVILLPNLDQLYSFENKGYQELLKKRIGIENVEGRFYGDEDDFKNDKNKFDYPLVFKSLAGSISSGVKLIRNSSESINYFKEIKKKSLKELFIGFKEKIKSIYKRNQRKIGDGKLKPVEKYSSINRKKFFQKRISFVTQKFIPDLDHDYKVLVFGEKYFVFRREVRKNDFRASGSGIFNWIVPPNEVLDFARIVVQKMDVPLISLDIVSTKNNGCAIVEFQGVGFGPIGLTGASYYFIYHNFKWSKIEHESVLEEEYTNAIHYFLTHSKIHENN